MDAGAIQKTRSLVLVARWWQVEVVYGVWFKDISLFSRGLLFNITIIITTTNIIILPSPTLQVSVFEGRLGSRLIVGN